MTPFFRLFPLALLATTGCSSPSPVSSEVERRAVLDQLAEHCKVPKSILQVHGDLIAIGGQDMMDVPYERIQCVLDGLKARGLDGNIGFIGNEAYE